jgi:hypothetical protein
MWSQSFVFFVKFHFSGDEHFDNTDQFWGYGKSNTPLHGFDFWEHAMSNVEGFPLFQQPFRLPSSRLIYFGGGRRLLHSSCIRHCIEGNVMVNIHTAECENYTRATKIPTPKSLTLKLATARFTETFENLQYLIQPSPECRRHTLNSGHKNWRTRTEISCLAVCSCRRV